MKTSQGSEQLNNMKIVKKKIKTFPPWIVVITIFLEKGRMLLFVIIY